MSKPFRFIAAALLAVTTAAAQADYVTTSQDVDFTFHAVNANTFTLRMENADNATGDWKTADYLSYLGFDGLVSGKVVIAGATVNVSPAPSTNTTWSFTAAQLTGQGCGKAGSSGAICLDANPNVLLTGDMLFTINLLGTGIDLTAITAPHLKVGFTDKNGSKPIGSLLSVNMSLEQPQIVTTPSGNANTAPDVTINTVPEPASLALTGLALLGVAAARRRARG